MKNICEFTLIKSTSNTVTFENVGNNTVSVKTSSTTTAQALSHISQKTYPTNRYVIYVNPSTTMDNDTWFINVTFNSNGSPSNVNVFDVYTFNADVEITGVYVYVRSGKTINATAQVMICTKVAWDQEPNVCRSYAASNAEITDIAVKNKAAIAETVDNGHKNLLDINFVSATVNTVLYKNKNDGTIYINGTNSSSLDGIPIQDIVSAETNSLNTRYTLPAGTYVLYLADTAIASNGAISLQIYMHDGTNMVRLTQTTTFAEFMYTATDKITYPYICVRIHTSGSTAVSQKTVTPMICSKADFDVSYKSVPYNFTQDELIEIVDSGAKNKLQNTAASKTENGVTWTVASDGTVTVSTTAGGATDASNLSITGKYISNTFNNCIIASPIDSSSDCYIYVAYSSNGSSEAVHSEVHSGDILNIRETYPYIQIILRIKSGTVLTTPITFYPMLCTKAAFGVSQKFVPYRPNWDFVGKDAMLSIQAKAANDTIFTFDISEYKGTASNRYRYGLLVGGYNASNPCLYHVFLNANNEATLTAVLSSGRTLTASTSGTALTITASDTMYGGLRLLWLD